MNDKFTIGGMNTLDTPMFGGFGGACILKDGDEIVGYNVISQLGAGGMGQVYLVENIQMHKKYALKVLPPHLSSNDRFIDRFRVEARVMADLNHPNIVGVMNIGHDKERKLYYLVMEFISSVDSCQPALHSLKDDEGLTVDGEGNSQITNKQYLSAEALAKEELTTNPSDLEGLLREKKKLPEDYVLKITKQLCSALSYAHNFRGKGIVHRDLKPSNVLLDSVGNAHIADFGLAKVVGQDYLKSMIDHSMQLTMAGNYIPSNMSLGEMNTMVDGNNSSSPSTNNQQPSTAAGTGTAGSLIGTYEYMAPEQQEGHEATVQSDIYSLGLIIYRMLTGRKIKGLWKMPSELGLNNKWDIILKGCIESEPEDRFSSVSEIIPLLDFDVKNQKAKPPREKDTSNKKSPVKWIITVIIIICVCIAGWFGYKEYEKNKFVDTTVVRIAQIEKGKRQQRDNQVNFHSANINDTTSVLEPVKTLVSKILDLPKLKLNQPETNKGLSDSESLEMSKLTGNSQTDITKAIAFAVNYIGMNTCFVRIAFKDKNTGRVISPRVQVIPFLGRGKANLYSIMRDRFSRIFSGDPKLESIIMKDENINKKLNRILSSSKTYKAQEISFNGLVGEKYLIRAEHGEYQTCKKTIVPPSSKTLIQTFYLISN